MVDDRDNGLICVYSAGEGTLCGNYANKRYCYRRKLTPSGSQAHTVSNHTVKPLPPLARRLPGIPVTLEILPLRFDPSTYFPLIHFRCFSSGLSVVSPALSLKVPGSYRLSREAETRWGIETRRYARLKSLTNELESFGGWAGAPRSLESGSNIGQKKYFERVN